MTKLVHLAVRCSGDSFAVTFFAGAGRFDDDDAPAEILEAPAPNIVGVGARSKNTGSLRDA